MNRHGASASPGRTTATMAKKSVSLFGERIFTFVFLKSIIMAAMVSLGDPWLERFVTYAYGVKLLREVYK